jgi:fumarate reductase subunit C
MTSTVTQVKLWYWQRISAMALALFVFAHLAIIVYAVRGGLSGAEILGRTHGNLGFGLFYAAFVLACVVHVPIGLVRILRETFGMREGAANSVAGLFALLLLVMGLRAVYGVVLA